MKTHSIPLRYTLMTYRLDQFWLPAAFWVLFLFMAWVMRNQTNVDNVVDAFLCGALPLMSGVLSAYALLDDPALELQFSSPRSAWSTILQRLGLIFAVVAAAALSFQALVAALGIDPFAPVTMAERQVTWLVPCLALSALGCLAALALAQCTFGAMLVGLVWIFQMIAQGWFVSNATARLFFLFIGAFAPEHPARAWTYLTVSTLVIPILVIAWVLLKKQERYI